MNTENQLSLPYEELPQVAGRSFIRDNFKQSARASYFIPLYQIEERDGYNQRIDYEGIEELAESIFSNGQHTPVTLDIVKQEDGSFKAFIDQGHRRLRALKLLLQQGKIDENYLVEFYSNKQEVTELQRMINQIVSNSNQCPLKPIEQASVVHAVKYNFGQQYKHEELATMFGMSRQKIDNLILFAEAPDDVRHHIKDMNFTNALEYIRSEVKRKKQADKVEESAGQSGMYVQPDPHDVNAKEAKELEELEKDIAINGTDNETDEEYEEKCKQLEVQRQAEEEKRLEKLAEIADKVTVANSNIEQYYGKKLADRAIRTWDEDFTDEGTGEVVTIQRNQIVLREGTELNEENAVLLFEEEVKEIWVYKVNPVAESVITEPVAGKEKDKYDTDRPEIAQIQNIIKLLDKVEVIADKIPDSQTSKDITDIIKWMRNDAMPLRDWIHTNKKQNKIR